MVRGKRYSEGRILKVLKKIEAGASIAIIGRARGIGTQTIYQCRQHRPASPDQADEWKDILSSAMSSGRLYDKIGVGDELVTGFLGRYDGKDVVVEFFTSGERAGQLRTAFWISRAALERMLAERGKLW